MLEIESGIAEAAVESVVFVAEFPGSDGGGNFVERFGIESQGFAHFARRHAVAIGNNVGRHGRAALTVAPVDILDNFFALVAAGQVEINVGPLAAFLGKKAFEEKLHADGIDGGDAQRITDGAVSGRTAPLHQNILLAAETNQIPDNKKVAGEIEFFD
jgi:hypothetical protein